MKCGFYEKEITPPLGGDMPGYFKNRPAVNIKDRLYAKAVVFCQGDSKDDMQTALLVVDAVQLEQKYCSLIQERASWYTGIPKEHISVSATHSHYGIPCGDEISIADEAYMDVFCRVAADCITMAFRNRRPCEAFYGKGQVEGISFVRDHLLKDGNVVTYATYSKYGDQIVGPNGKADPELPVLFLRDTDGHPMGCLASFACHLDCIGGSEYSGDYPSEMSRCLKKVYGEDFVSMYLAGACGDITHTDSLNGISGNYIEMGRCLAEEIVDVVKTAEPMSDVVDSRKEYVQMKRRRATPEQLEEARKVIASQEPIDPNAVIGHTESELLLLYEAECAGTPDEMSFPIHVIGIGEAWIFALPGEVYGRYGMEIKENCPGKRALISELSNMIAGYIPLKECFGTEIYPVKTMCSSSFLDMESGEKLVAKALEISRKMVETR